MWESKPNFPLKKNISFIFIIIPLSLSLVHNACNDVIYDGYHNIFCLHFKVKKFVDGKISRDCLSNYVP